MLYPTNTPFSTLSDTIMLSIVQGAGLLTGNIDAYGGGGYNTR
jgi:hypothetical protein